MQRMFALVVTPRRQGYHESRRCSKDTWPESYITKSTSIRRYMLTCWCWQASTGGPEVYNLEQALLGHIPLHETTCFIRFGTDKPGAPSST